MREDLGEVATGRAGPGTKGRRTSFRPWDGDRPPTDVLDGDVGAVFLPAHERKLGPAGSKLWRHLLEVRGYGDRVIELNLPRLARYLRMPERTLDRALRRLSDAWLVDRSRVRLQTGSTTWCSHLTVRVWGGLSVHRGVETAWAPIAAVAWCERAGSWGGKRVKKPREAARQDGCADVKMALSGDLKPVRQSGEQALSPPSWRSSSLTSLMSTRTSCSTNVEQERASTQGADRAPVSNLTRGGTTSTALRLEETPAQATPVPRKNPTYQLDTQAIPVVKLGPEKLSGDPDDPDPRQRQLTRLAWMQLLVRAYNNAYERSGIPGVKARLHLPGNREKVTFSTWDPQKGVTPGSVGGGRGREQGASARGVEAWPAFAKLLAAARVLQERDIPPEAWAEWQVGRIRKRVLITRVFCASEVSHNAVRAIFRKESGYSYGTGGNAIGQIPQVVYEQMYRNREAARRARGIDDLFGLPPWYVAIRQPEIDQGVVDPMERFPSAIVPGAEYRARAEALATAALQPEPTKVDRTNELALEQMFRRQEAATIARGMPPLHISAKPWYFEKRKRELSEGVTDPMTRFPATVGDL